MTVISNWRNFNWRTSTDKEYRKVFETYVRDFFERSPEAVDLMKNSTEIYSESFVTFVKDILCSLEETRKKGSVAAQ